MCPPSPPSTLSSPPGRRLFISDPSVQDSIRELRALLDRIESNAFSSTGELGSLEGNCLLPLNRFQSQLLADLATTLVPRSTWWSKIEGPDWWAMCGVLGEDSGSRVTVFISATTDRDVLP